MDHKAFEQCVYELKRKIANIDMAIGLMEDEIHGKELDFSTIIALAQNNWEIW